MDHDIPNLRTPDMAPIVVSSIRDSITSSFGITHFSILGDHLHFIIEVESKEALSSGMQALEMRIARRINRYLGRTGTVFIDRFHSRELATPREVRVAIEYVLCNWLHHVDGAEGIDPYSSGRWFDGWETPPPVPATPSPVVAPRTWLGAAGWRRYGPLKATR